MSMTNFVTGQKVKDSSAKPLNYISSWRAKRGYSLTVLAHLTQLSKGTLSKIENGKSGWSDLALQKIAWALRVKRGWLLDYDPFDPDDVKVLLGELERSSPDDKAEAERMLRDLLDEAA